MDINKSKLLLHYIENLQKDENICDEERLKFSICQINHNGDVDGYFDEAYAGLPFGNKINFNLFNCSAEFKILFVYLEQLIILQPGELIILADFVWAANADVEIFKVIARYNGKLPERVGFRLFRNDNFKVINNN